MTVEGGRRGLGGEAGGFPGWWWRRRLQQTIHLAAVGAGVNGWG